MWKKWIIRAAFWYADRAFNKWLLTKTETEKEVVIELLNSFQQYLLSLRAPWGEKLANLLEDWKD